MALMTPITLLANITSSDQHECRRVCQAAPAHEQFNEEEHDAHYAVGQHHVQRPRSHTSSSLPPAHEQSNEEEHDAHYAVGQHHVQRPPQEHTSMYDRTRLPPMEAPILANTSALMLVCTAGFEPAICGL